MTRIEEERIKETGNMVNVWIYDASEANRVTRIQSRYREITKAGKRDVKPGL